MLNPGKRIRAGVVTRQPAAALEAVGGGIREAGASASAPGLHDSARMVAQRARLSAAFGNGAPEPVAPVTPHGHAHQGATVQRETYDKTWDSTALGGYWYGVPKKKKALQDHFAQIRTLLAVAKKNLNGCQPADRESFTGTAQGTTLQELGDYENQTVAWEDAGTLIAGADAKLLLATGLVEPMRATLDDIKHKRELSEARDKELKRQQHETDEAERRLAKQQKDEERRLAQQQEEVEAARRDEEFKQYEAKQKAIRKVLGNNFGACFKLCGDDLDLLGDLTSQISIGEGGVLSNSLTLLEARALLVLLKGHKLKLEMANKLLTRLREGQASQLDALMNRITVDQAPSLLKLLGAYGQAADIATPVCEVLDAPGAKAPALVRLLEVQQVPPARLTLYLVQEAVPIARLETVLRSCTAKQLGDLFAYGKLGLGGATGAAAVENIILALGKLGDAAQLLDLMQKHSGLPAATLLRIVGAHLSAACWDPSVADVSTILYHYRKHVIDENGGGGPGAKDVEQFSADTALPLAHWNTGRVSPQGDGWKITGPPGGTYDLVNRKPFTFWYV